MGGRPFWNDHRDAELKRQWFDDVPGPKIAGHFGIAAQTVYRRAGELGLPKRGLRRPFGGGRRNVRFTDHVPPDLARDLRILAADNTLSLAKIGHRLGLSRWQVRGFLRKLGIERDNSRKAVRMRQGAGASKNWKNARIAPKPLAAPAAADPRADDEAEIEAWLQDRTPTQCPDGYAMGSRWSVGLGMSI